MLSTKLYATASAAMIAMATPALAETVSLTAADQNVNDNIVVADRVFAEKDGWLVLHEVDPNTPNFDQLGDVIGKTWIEEGENVNVAIAAMRDIAKDERVVMMIYNDDGAQERSFEPGEDTPYTVDGNVVMLVVKNEA